MGFSGGGGGGGGAAGTGGKVGKFTGSGASTSIGDSAITDDGSAVTIAEPTTIVGATTVRKAGIATTKTTGLLVQNNTAGIVGTTVQISPSLVFEAHARVSGADATHLIRLTEITNTSGNPSLLIEYSTDGGSTWSTAFTWYAATPGQFVAALAAFTYVCTGAATGYQFDADASGMFRGGSGDLQLLARAATLAMLLRSPVTSAGIAAFRLYASGGTRGAGEMLVEFGDVAAGFTLRAAIMGDGSYNGPLSVVTATPKTGDYTAVARDEVWLDATGGAFDFTLPTAAGAAGKHIIAHMTAASANVVTLKTTGGQTISGSASAALTLGNAVSIETARFSSDGSNWWLERSSTVL